MQRLAVFDTNILIDLFSGHVQAKDTLSRFPVNRAISLMTWIEVMVGAKKHSQESRTREALDTFEILPLSSAVAERSVLLRQELGMKLPDAIILVTAQIYSRELVTRNVKDFEGISGVTIPYSLQ